MDQRISNIVCTADYFPPAPSRHFPGKPACCLVVGDALSKAKPGQLGACRCIPRNQKSALRGVRLRTPLVLQLRCCLIPCLIPTDEAALQKRLMFATFARTIMGIRSGRRYRYGSLQCLLSLIVMQCRESWKLLAISLLAHT